MTQKALKPVILLIAASLALVAQEPAGIKAPRKHPVKVMAQSKSTPQPQRIDLNSASQEDLKKVPGLTDELAARIIAGRPYLTKSNLVTRSIVPLDAYQAIQGWVMVKQKVAVK